MSANIPQNRKNSMVKLDPISKTEAPAILNTENDDNDNKCNSSDPSGGQTARCVDPSPEWIAVKLRTTPTLFRPKSTEVISSPYLSPASNKKEKSRKAIKARHRRVRVRPCLTVELSKARSGAEVLRISLEELGWRWREVIDTTVGL